ncbi:MAG: AAA family ATPase [Candidatus Lokiarchaeota archaeon]|nr:AAA family ATPase [Candidatus Lokiarchaeota archaeon]
MNQNKKNKKKSKKSIEKSEFGFYGAKALFDPYFIPDQLIARKKEQKYLLNLLDDSIEDRFSANVALYGLRGVGKTVLVNKTIQRLVNNVKQPEIENESELNLIPFFVDCEGKEFDQVIFSIINGLAKRLDYDINPDMILSSNTASLWNLFKMLVNKLNASLMIFIDSVEYINPKLINKLHDFAKSESIILIHTFNAATSSPFLSDFKKPDFKISMDIYNYNSLFKIGKDRCRMAIRNRVDDSMIKYVVDLVGKFDKKVPGPMIRVLSDLYPVLEDYDPSMSNQIREVCRYQFQGFAIDELSLADYIADSDILDRIFVDNITSYFKTTDEFYIDYEELKNNYVIACESIEQKMSEKNFHSTLKNLEQISLLLPSEIGLPEKEKVNSIGSNFMLQNNIHLNTLKSPRYITVPTDLLNDMMDIAFGAY